MARLLRMPAIAANATEALLGQWLLAEGAEFRAGDALAVVETEKAAVDVSADRPGRLVRSLAASGANVEVGDPIALLADPGEDIADIDATLAQLGAATAGAPTGQAPAGQTPASPAPASPAPAGPAPTSASATGGQSADNGGRVFVSPLARRLASQAGLVIATLTGTGQNGRIVRRDVEKAIAARTDAPSGTSAPQGSATYQDTPHTRMRLAIAQRLVASVTQAPHFVLRASCRADALLSARASINAALADDGVKVSVNDFIVKAMGWALRRVPDMNVIWLDQATRRFDSADIAVAIALPTGLITPVVRGVDRLPIADLALTIQDLAERARSGRLQPSDLEGGSMTVSNLGMHGVEEFSAIINPPHASILAVGAVTREVVVEEDDDITVASIIRVTLSVDHRPLDGVIAARWLAAFTKAIENPVLLLA